MRRLTRSQWLALAGVVLLLAGAFTLRDRGASPVAGPDLSALRQAAALSPCPPGLGPDLPELTLPCLGGGDDVALGGAPPGRPTLVNVWASWCGPCREEVPDLIAFSRAAGDRVGLVGVLTQDTEANGLEFSRQFGIGYPSLVDEQGDVLRAYAPGPPVTLFLDAAGAVRHVHTGRFQDLTQLETLVADHLGVRL